MKSLSDIEIGTVVVDSDGRICKVTNKTSSSIEVYMEKTNSKGINCKQWFDFEKEFTKRFNLTP